MDGLTVLKSENLIKQEKEGEKTLDQMTLPERSDLLKQAYALLENADDVTDDEMAVVERLETAMENKVASWGLMIKKVIEAVEILSIEEDYHKRKAEQAKERAEKFKKKIESMSGYLKQKMLDCNKKKFETPLITVSLKKQRQSVIIDESADLEKPENAEFVQVTVSRRWDKKAIKDKLDQGQLFKTVKLSDPDFTISIK